jgi:UrcA family protein
MNTRKYMINDHLTLSNRQTCQVVAFALFIDPVLGQHSWLLLHRSSMEIGIMNNARDFFNRYKQLRLVSLATCAIGLLLLISPVLADNSIPEPGVAGIPDGNGDRSGFFSDDYDKKVIVTEGPVIRRQEGRTKRGFPIEIIELTRRVSYADLDLSKEADVSVFELRVETAAKRSCEQLANKQSFESTSASAITRCVSEAVDRSVEQMQAAIAANQ